MVLLNCVQCGSLEVGVGCQTGLKLYLKLLGHSKEQQLVIPHWELLVFPASILEKHCYHLLSEGIAHHCGAHTNITVHVCFNHHYVVIIKKEDMDGNMCLFK